MTSQDTFFLLRQPSPHRMVIQYHPTIGHLFVPNLQALIPSEDGSYFVRTNPQGFRSDVPFIPTKGNKPRILFLGDSATAGDGVANEQRFSDLLGQLLGAEVYNFAVSGTGTDQQVLIYEQFAKDIAADLIVFMVNVGNIARIQQTHRETIDRASGKNVLVPKPYFIMEHEKLVLQNVPVPRERPEKTAKNTSDGGSWLKKQAKQFAEQLGVTDALKKLTVGTPYPDYDSAETDGWQLMEALLKRFIAASAPTPVLIVPLPTHNYYRYGAKPTYQPLFESLATTRVQVLDITTPLTQLPKTEIENLALAHDEHHFSPAGHQHITRIMAQEIKKVFPVVVSMEQNHPTPQTSPDKPTYILGISCFYHNSAACLIKDGVIVAAVEEERLSRVKNDRRFPIKAVWYCLEEAGILPKDLTAVAYYDNAYQTFERILHNQMHLGEAGAKTFERVLPTWLQFKLHIPQLVRQYLQYDGLILQGNHHRSHAASAFYPSPYTQAAVLTIDGVGEWATASISHAQGTEIKLLKEMHYPHSLGLLYSAFTQFTGFKVNSGEYKMMGLAPYGEPTYVQQIYDHLVQVHDDGSLTLNLEYFGFLGEDRMTNAKFAELFGGAARHPDERITHREMNMARSIQVVTEDIMLKMAQHAHDLTGEKVLCMAGGVALNCVANGRILREGAFEDIWIQPAAGDSGCALGVALDVYHHYLGKPRPERATTRPLQGGSYWGPAYSDDEIKAFLETYGHQYHTLPPENRADTIAQLLEAGKVVGHFDGRVEFGPRALGSRSIMGDARNQEMQATLNLKIKYRESFRPFAPTVLAERVSDYFELDRESPYMLLVANVQKNRRLPFERGTGEDMLEIVRTPRSDVPAITHVDYSARIQTIHAADHPHYHALIQAFERRTGYGVIVNTSFNVRGEPIICTPQDAYRCFMGTEMDVLVMGNFLLLKPEQPEWTLPKGHIENDDKETPATLDNTALLDQLRRFFKEDWLPAVRPYTTMLEIAPQNSSWRNAVNPSVTALFELPATLDTRAIDTTAMATAMAQFWQEHPAKTTLQTLTAKLLTLGIQHQPEGIRETLETVSDAIYVMY